MAPESLLCRWTPHNIRYPEEVVDSISYLVYSVNYLLCYYMYLVVCIIVGISDSD